MSEPTESHTISYVDGESGERSSFVAPYVVVALQCHQPLVMPMRLSIAEVEEVRLGRGERKYSRLVDGGRGVLSIDIEDPTMSSAHARMLKEPQGWRVVDDGSKNGTFVNGARCQESWLRDGDLVEVGTTVLLFRDRVRRQIGDPVDVDADERTTNPAPLTTLHVELQRSLSALARVAGSDVPIVILGETGSGKEVIARAVHTLSGRSGQFVGVNCGALAAGLLEAELFGHKKGAFTGATDERAGLFRTADRGTLFLDEVAELPEPAQVALLRVLQEREVRPVGGDRAVPVDVRVVAATNQDLQGRVSSGAFRDDLFARLSGRTVTLPPLRARREDIGLLVAWLLPRVAPRNAHTLRLSRRAARALFAYEWPRNIRELEHALRAAVALVEGDQIGLEHLPPEVIAAVRPGGGDDDDELKAQLLELLALHRGNVAKVAHAMKKAPAQIRRWARRYEIDLGRFRE